MKKKIFLVFFIVIFLIFCFFSFVFIEYIYTQRTNKNMITYCSQSNTDECYRRMFELMLPKLLLYDAKINGREIELIGFDPDNVMIDSFEALKQSDALLGYGIYHSAAYEEKYSELFDKYSYAFDCGVPYFNTNTPKCLFFSECIATDKFLIWDYLYTREMQVSSGKSHTIQEKLKELELQDKKVFVKIDADLADIVAIPEVIKNSQNITGVTMTFHINTPKDIIDRLKLLDKLNEDFVLVSRHTIFNFENYQSRVIGSKYYDGVLNSNLFFLSYVNKNLLDSYKISLVQNTDKYYKKKNVDKTDVQKIYKRDIAKSDISFVVVITEKMRQFIYNFKG